MNKIYDQGRMVPGIISSIILTFTIPLYILVIPHLGKYTLIALICISVALILLVSFVKVQFELNVEKNEFRRRRSFFGINFGSYQSLNHYDSLVVRSSGLKFKYNQVIGKHENLGYNPSCTPLYRTWILEAVQSETGKSKLLFTGNKKVVMELASTIGEANNNLTLYQDRLGFEYKKQFNTFNGQITFFNQPLDLES